MNDQETTSIQNKTGKPSLSKTHNSRYATAGAATLALFGGLAGVLVGWIIGTAPRSVPGQGTLAGADIITTTLVAGLLGVGIGALIGALWGLNIPRESAAPVDQGPLDSERVVPLDYIGKGYEQAFSPERSEWGEPELRQQEPSPAIIEPGPMVAMPGVSEDVLMPPVQTANPHRSNPQGDVDVLEGNLIVEEHIQNPKPKIQNSPQEAAMDDRQAGQDSNNVTGTQGAIDPETGAYGTAGTPVTTGYGVSGSTIGTGSSQVRDEHEAGDFAGSTPDSASYEMGGRGSDDTPTPSGPDDSSDTPVQEKYEGSMEDEAPAQSDPRTRDVYEAGPAYGPGIGQSKESIASAETSHNSDASLDSPPSSKLINSEETDASAGTDIAGTSDPRGLGDNTDET